MDNHGNSLLRVQIGPVQDFIAAARISRDLWSGSYLLSRLMAAGVHALRAHNGCQLVFPDADELGICAFFHPTHPEWKAGAEIPCLSNKLMAYVPTAEAEATAQGVADAIRAQWQNIIAQVWALMPARLRNNTELHHRYKTQATHHLSVEYAHLPMDLSLEEMHRLAAGVEQKAPLAVALESAAKNPAARYAALYYLVDHCLNAARKVRAFEAWNAGQGRDAAWQAGADWAKDSLTGKEERLFRWSQDSHLFGDWPYAEDFSHHPGDVIGAMTLIKRLWYKEVMAAHQEYLPEHNAAYGPNDSDTDEENHYYAVLVMDGDRIGAALTREPNFDVDEAYHKKFSAKLAEFAQQKAGARVKEHGGKLIYAGGDDVMALLPLDKALSCAQALSKDFGETMEAIRKGMTVSAGIAVAHSAAPLQDVVAAARRAESRAKNTLKRGAFSVSIMKRSGEIAEWGAKWGSGACELVDLWQKLIQEQKISAKGAHRYAELLTPYLRSRSGLLTYAEAADFDSAQKDILLAEFDSMLQRQLEVSDKAERAKVKQALSDALTLYLNSPDKKEEQEEKEEEKKKPITADELLPMCSLIAFFGRNPNKTNKQ